MKIVIDIPEKVLTAIQNGKDYRYDIHTAIAQGQVLPKKYGDLVDRDTLINLCKNYTKENAIGLILAGREDYLPTVIKADKGETKEDNPCPCIECISTNFKRDCQYCKAWAKWCLE